MKEKVSSYIFWLMFIFTVLPYSVVDHMVSTYIILVTIHTSLQCQGNREAHLTNNKGTIFFFALKFWQIPEPNPNSEELIPWGVPMNISTEFEKQVFKMVPISKEGGGPLLGEQN